jgi:hypothetical protein
LARSKTRASLQRHPVVVVVGELASVGDDVDNVRFEQSF